MTNELEEALFVDRLQLVAIDHPADVDVYPERRLRSAAAAVPAAVGARRASAARAVDEHGHDVLPRSRALDRRYPDDFRSRRFAATRSRTR